MKTQFDASFWFYLLELFEGKISLTEILNMELNILLELKQHREKVIQDRINNMKK